MDMIDFMRSANSVVLEDARFLTLPRFLTLIPTVGSQSLFFFLFLLSLLCIRKEYAVRNIEPAPGHPLLTLPLNDARSLILRFMEV